MKRVKRAALVALGVLLALAVAETALWLGGEKLGWPIWEDPSWSLPDLQTRNRLRPGRHEQFGGEYVVGPEGFRGRLAPDARALALGDSTTFGVRVKDAETFPALLGAANGGFPGFNSEQGERLWAHSALAGLRPKIVFIMYGSNDIRLSSAPDWFFHGLRQFAARSRAATSLLRLEQALWREEPEWRARAWIPAVSRRRYKAALKRLAARARAGGAVAVFVTPPWDAAQLTPALGSLERHADYVAAMREAAAEYGVPLVDLAGELEAMPPERKAAEFLDHAHFSPRGHAHAARLLRPWLDCADRGDCPPR